MKKRKINLNNTIENIFLFVVIPVFIVITGLFEYRVFNVIYFSLSEVLFWMIGVVLLLVVRRKSRDVISEDVRTETNKNETVNDALLNTPAPILLVNLDSNEVVWVNREFKNLTGVSGDCFGKRISDILSDFDIKWVLEGQRKKPELYYLGDHVFEIYAGLIRHKNGDGTCLFASLYWIDCTEVENLKKQILEKRIVVGELVCDNYEEVSRSASESLRASMMASLDSVFRSWLNKNNIDCIFRQTDRDRYVFFLNDSDFQKFFDARFSILDEVHSVIAPDGMPVTVSIGLGRDTEDFETAEKYASLAIDMALSRGGDQAVVRTKTGFSFFGGRTDEKERNTRVRSRIMADVLRGLISDAKQVYAMGHNIADLDSLGGAIGVVCAARKLGKKAKIVIDPINSNAGLMVEKMLLVPEYQDVFITPDQAILEIEPNSLGVIVDTNRKNYVEAPNLLSAFSRIAVIDHHRRAADYIDNAVLNIHEPTASSVCELVAEVLGYIIENGDMLRSEATAMLAGIILDTKSFSVKTGVRSFEAAAFLRKNGADAIEIRKLFQSDLDCYIMRADIVKKAMFFENIYAISAIDDDVDRAIASQAADDLTNIEGVAGSFVVFKLNGAVSISARSLGRINVQVIMEKLGGGGHFTTAGAQIKDKTVAETVNMLKDAITIYQFEQL